MVQILCFDRLPERKTNFRRWPSIYIINPLLTKLVQSELSHLDITLVPQGICVFFNCQTNVKVPSHIPKGFFCTFYRAFHIYPFFIHDSEIEIVIQVETARYHL